MKIRAFLIKKQNKRNNEHGSAIMLAVLLMIVMLAIVSALTIAVVAGVKKSAQTRDYTYHSLAADSALNDALRTANDEIFGSGITAIENHVGVANAKTGSLTLENQVGGEVKWRWYAINTPSTIPYTDYTIYATGYKGDDPNGENAFHYSARLKSFPYNGAASSSNDTPQYLIPPSGLFTKGTVGFKGMDISNSTSFYTYNSQGGSPTGGNASTTRSEVSVAGEGNFIFRDYNGHVKSGNIYNLPEDTDRSERCGGEDCPMPTIAYKYDIAPAWTFSQQNMKNISGNLDGEDLCTNYSDYRTSSHGAVLEPDNITQNYLCINDLIIDSNTQLAPRFSTGSPLYLFVRGNVTVEPGVTLNEASGSGNRGPTALRIFTAGNVNIKGNLAVPTKVSALIHATDQGECTVGQTGRKVDVYGAVSCNELFAAGETSFWHDLQASQVGVNESEVKRAWSLSNYDITSGLTE